MNTIFGKNFVPIFDLHLPIYQVCNLWKIVVICGRNLWKIVKMLLLQAFVRHIGSAFVYPVQVTWSGSRRGLLNQGNPFHQKVQELLGKFGPAL